MLLGAAIVLVLMLAAAVTARCITRPACPGASYSGPLPPLTDEERRSPRALKRHIEAIAAREHNIAHYDELEKVARYIEATLASFGYAVGRQEFVVDGKRGPQHRRGDRAARRNRRS